MTRAKAAIRISIFVTLAALIVVVWPATAGAGSYEWVSVAVGGAAGDGASGDPSISADGRYVAFESSAGNLVSDDTNATGDVFVRDRETGITNRVSVAGDGSQADGASGSASISGDGRYVAFTSSATNLVPGDTNGVSDIFVHDRQTGATARVSMATGGGQAGGESRYPSISADGAWIAFESDATDLVPGDTNSRCDIFVHERATGTTTRVSVATDGTQADDGSHRPAISGDGGCVAFHSDAETIAPPTMYSGGADATLGTLGTVVPPPPQVTTGTRVFYHDRATGETSELVLHYAARDLGEGPHMPSISADGRYVAFGCWVAYESPAVYVCETASGQVERHEVGAVDFVEGVPRDFPTSLSGDGRYVAVGIDPAGDPPALGASTTLVVRDLKTETGAQLDMGPYGAGPFRISADGRHVAFACWTGWDPADTNHLDDVYVTSNPALDISLRGTDRYDTAVKISRAGFPERLPAGAGLVLATGETFQEALCGAPLAAAYGGPVLLTPKNGLDSRVRSEIYRLDPDYVICIGLAKAFTDSLQVSLGAGVEPVGLEGPPSTTTGTTVPTATTPTVRAAVAAAASGTSATGVGIPTTTTLRPVTTVPGPLPSCTLIVIEGSTVYEMSYKVALALKARVGSLTGATAIITRGDLFPDAIGVAPLACANKWPILLTGPSVTNALNIYAAMSLAQTGIDKAIKVGTYAKLPMGVAGLANLSGDDRYFTNRNVAEWAKANGGLSFAHLGIATGDKFPDGLAAGPYLALDQGSLLLSPLAGLPPVIAAEITANAGAIDHFSFFAMIEPVMGQVKALIP